MRLCRKLTPIVLAIVLAATITFVAVAPVSAQPPTPPPGGGGGGPSDIKIDIRAYIDGKSQLIIKRNTVQWHHLDWAAPGRLDFANLPTIINGIEWYPQWADVPDAENRWCDCFSSTYVGLTPSLPESDMEVELRVIQARHSLSIAQHPSIDNDYTLIVDFDDNPPGGADWYECELVLSVTPVVPSVTPWGAGAMVAILGLLLVYMVRRRQTALKV